MTILLVNHQSPGDILMLTACVRDLKKVMPDIVVGVQTTAMELWENNPNVTKDYGRADRIIQMNYPLIHQSTKGAHHFIHGFHQYLEEKLKTRIPVTDFCVDVYLSEEEKKSTFVPDNVGNKPFWIIDAGYKSDFTCKMWEFARYQEVVNRTKDRINWVQIGSSKHLHKPLENVINMIDKTNHRQFIQLMWYASGVLTPVSYPMHLATMPMKDSKRKRPCVVIAGAREPSVWEQYTCHQYIHNCGMLDCCQSGACWKSRIEFIDDNSKQNERICLKPVKTQSGQVIPKCLDMITVDDVVNRINMYLDNM